MPAFSPFNYLLSLSFSFSSKLVLRSISLPDSLRFRFFSFVCTVHSCSSSFEAIGWALPVSLFMHGLTTSLWGELLHTWFSHTSPDPFMLVVFMLTIPPGCAYLFGLAFLSNVCCILGILKSTVFDGKIYQPPPSDSESSNLLCSFHYFSTSSTDNFLPSFYDISAKVGLCTSISMCATFHCVYCLFWKRYATGQSCACDVSHFSLMGNVFEVIVILFFLYSY